MRADDHVRVLSVYAPAGEARTLKAELDPTALVYSICLSAEYTGAQPVDNDEPLAVLHLQDSEARCYPTQQYGCDLPGLVWPAHAKLEVAENVRASLHVTYGVCRGE
jgi:hypothetical protein